MYYALNEDELKIIQEVSKVTCTDFELINHLIPVESLLAAVENMLVEYHNKEEKLEDLQENIKDNYKPISNAEMYGVTDKDFI